MWSDSQVVRRYCTRGLPSPYTRRQECPKNLLKDVLGTRPQDMLAPRHVWEPWSMTQRISELLYTKRFRVVFWLLAVKVYTACSLEMGYDFGSNSTLAVAMPLVMKSAKLSRPDSCSVDVGREAPKFWFEFCCGFWVDFFSKEKGRQKIPRKIHPGICSEKFPSDFCRSLVLTNCPDKLTSHRRSRASRRGGCHAWFKSEGFPDLDLSVPICTSKIVSFEFGTFPTLSGFSRLFWGSSRFWARKPPFSTGGFKRGGGGLPDVDLSFSGLSRLYRDFPDSFGDFPDLSFSSSSDLGLLKRPIRSPGAFPKGSGAQSGP